MLRIKPYSVGPFMKYIREFEGLRGLMALWVVIGHWSTTALIPHRIGMTKLYNGYAVDVFVILSGFAITALIDKRPERYGLYISRRILRIFPVYLLFLAISVLTVNLAFNVWSTIPTGHMMDRRADIAASSIQYFWPHLGAHLPALHGLIPRNILPNTDYAFLGQAWSISLEWQFYLVAPFLIGALHGKFSARKIAVFISVAVVAILIERRMPEGFLGTHLPDFYIGITSFYFLKARLSDNPAVRQLPIVPLWLAAMVLCIYFRSPAALPYAIWASMLAIVIRSAEGDCGVSRKLSGLLTSRPIQNLGQMAYSIYLSHMLVIVLSLALLNRLGLAASPVSAPLLLVMALIGTLAVSTVSFRLVEKPFHEMGRRLQDRRREAAA